MKYFLSNSIKVLLATLVMFSFTACSDDDDEPSGPQVSSQLYATWMLDSKQVDGTVEFDLSCTETIEYQFLSNRTYVKTTYTGSNTPCDIALTINGSWEIVDENTITLTPSSSTINPETLSFTIVDNNATLQVNRSQALIEFYERQ